MSGVSFSRALNTEHRFMASAFDSVWFIFMNDCRPNPIHLLPIHTHTHLPVCNSVKISQTHTHTHAYIYLPVCNSVCDLNAHTHTPASNCFNITCTTNESSALINPELHRPGYNSCSLHKHKTHTHAITTHQFTLLSNQHN